MTTFDIKVAIGLSVDADHKEFNLKVRDLKNIGAALNGTGTSFDETEDALFLTASVEGEFVGEVVHTVVNAVRENALAVHVNDTELTVNDTSENGEFVVVHMSNVAVDD